MKRAQAALRAITRADTPETIAAEIAASQEEAREAGAEAARQAELARELLDDDQAEAAEARSRSEDRRRRRAEARVAELRERLAAATWQAREAAFRRHRKLLVTAGYKVVLAAEALAEANEAAIAARRAAVAELGNDQGLPALHYAGIALPDSIRLWERRVEHTLAQFETAELPRPQPVAPPAVPGAKRAPVQAISAPAKPPIAAALQPAPAPVAEAAPPAPSPRPREPFRDPPPGPGEKQVHIMQAGMMSLKDGRQVTLGDRINLPEDQARRILEHGGGTYVKFDTAAEPEPALEAAS